MSYRGRGGGLRQGGLNAGEGGKYRLNPKKSSLVIEYMIEGYVLEQGHVQERGQGHVLEQGQGYVLEQGQGHVLEQWQGYVLEQEEVPE